MSEKLSVVLVSGLRERLQMAAMVASVGAVSGNEVSVFVTMNALRYFVKGAGKRAPAEGEVGQIMETKNVPPFDELFRNSVELGDARIHPCSMAMDLLALEPEDLEPYVSEAMGLTKFLDVARDSQVWTF